MALVYSTHTSLTLLSGVKVATVTDCPGAGTHASLCWGQQEQSEDAVIEHGPGEINAYKLLVAIKRRAPMPLCAGGRSCRRRIQSHRGRDKCILRASLGHAWSVFFASPIHCAHCACV
eukprot:4967575-Pleurochrysis_carterae.AAC.1